MSALRATLIGTLIVGILDIGEVLIFYTLRGANWKRVLQPIAAGVLGREAAFKGGVATALLGLALHFVIAFGVVAVFVAASRKLPILVRHPIVIGALYGLAVHAVMKFVVIPMSALGPPTGPSPAFWPLYANTLFAHIVCIGIPTALIARRASLPAR